MQYSNLVRILAPMFVLFFVLGCETTQQRPDGLVLLNRLNSKDMEFQNKLRSAVNKFGTLIEVYVDPSELDLYRTDKKQNITNYKYLVKPKPGASLENFADAKNNMIN